jgi:hypothetical protein
MSAEPHDDPSDHVALWRRWMRLHNQDDHVVRWHRGAHRRSMRDARQRLEGLPSDRLERLSACGFLDAYSEIAAHQIVAERQRRRQTTLQ